ncbi:MAG: SMK killer toxin resistance protein [Vezdaea acicularis]|nr:MAG: SMK killer toxin resistance protein [Vezdaea acicularis]
MSQFFTQLFESIFTPGPTPSLVLATNVSFAALQLLLAVLFIATYSVHFAVLSFLCGGLWWAINWFANEVTAAKAKEEEAERLRGIRKGREGVGAAGGDTTATEEEGEGTEGEGEGIVKGGGKGGTALEVQDKADLKKRRSAGSGTEASTEDEWEKVGGEEGDR